MRFFATTCLALLMVSPALAGAPASDCENHDPLVAKQGCTAILAAGQNMQSLDFEAYNNRALAELALQEPQDALQDALAGVALNPDNGPIHLALARAYLALNQPEKALDAVNQALTLSPNESGGYVLLGQLQLARGDWRASIAEQNRALQRDPNDADAYMARAMAEMAGGDIQTALADVNKAAAQGTTDPRVHLVRGLAAAAAADWQTALAEETQYLAQDPDNVYALLVQSQAQQMQGNNVAALAEINHAIAVFPENIELYERRAGLEDALGQFQDEATDLTTVINGADQNHMTDALYRNLLLRAQLYMQLKQPQKAQSDIARAIALQPKHWEAYVLQAVMERTAGQLDAAMTDDEKALALNPGNTQIYSDLSLVHGAQHNYAAAAADEAAILKTQPHSAPDLNNRCWFLALDGKLNEALGYCQQALQITPNDPATLDSTGFVYLRLQNNQQAVHYYDQALKGDPKMASSLYGRALAEQKLGDDKKAAADMALAKQYDPDIEKDFGT